MKHEGMHGKLFFLLCTEVNLIIHSQQKKKNTLLFDFMCCYQGQNLYISHP